MQISLLNPTKVLGGDSSLLYEDIINSIKYILFIAVILIVTQSAFAQGIEADYYFVSGEASAADACRFQDGLLKLFDDRNEEIYSDQITPRQGNDISVTSFYRGQEGLGVYVSESGQLLGYKLEFYDSGWFSSELVSEVLCVFNGYAMEELNELVPAL